MTEDRTPVLIIPCSGIGKVHGLISRESAYLATDEYAPDKTDVVCLALLVGEDEETLARVRAHACVTIDGCGKACAEKNVRIAGGEVAKAFQVARTLSRHRGSQPGSGSELTEDGWRIAREIAQAVAETAGQIGTAGEVGSCLRK